MIDMKKQPLLKMIPMYRLRWICRVPRITLLLACLSCLPLSSQAQGFGTGNRARTGTSRSSATYPTSSEMGGATVTYDQETRKLIVVTDDETALSISQVVTNLSRPAPQVLIKCVFLSVTHRDELDVGVEGSYTKNIGGGQTGIVSQIFGLAAAGAAPVPPGAGIYQIVGSDFQATLRMIQQAGKTEILSRPSIMARNNQQASITVGQRVPLVTNVRLDQNNNQNSSITYENVGILLNVTPFITSDGMVEMIVSPEISDISEKSTTVGDGITAPIINTRSADTVVVTPDGQTIVIGGLMASTKLDTEHKVPILGDIPVLGWAFKRKIKNDVKTELLIFLTPHVIRENSQLAAVTSAEQKGKSLVPKAFSEEQLDWYLDKGGASEAPPPDKKKKKK
jgi:general secretion pathway protein D